MQMIQQFEEAANIIQEMDFTHESLLASFNSENHVMTVNRDFFSKNGFPAEYNNKAQISDPFSRLLWELFIMYPYINCITIARPYYCMLWASVGRSIPPLNAFHAEHFYGEIVCTDRDPEPFDQFEEYQKGLIVRAIGNRNLKEKPAILLRGFGAIVFGNSAMQVVDRLKTLEKIADVAWHIYSGLQQNISYLDYSQLNAYYTLSNDSKNPPAQKDNWN